MDSLSNFVPLGVAQFAALTSAQPLPGVGSPATIPVGPNIIAIIVPETQACRYRDDGTAPTATVGMLLVAGQPFVYSGDLSAFEMIQATATATATVAYYKRVG